MLAYHYDRTGQLLDIDDGVHDPEAFSYDAYGNLLQSATDFDEVTTYTYDDADRLTDIDVPGADNAVTFTFDALGRHATRVLQTTPTSTDTYRYVGSSETAWRIETSGGPTRTSGIGPDQSRLSVGDGTSFAWTLPDLHGSTAAGVNAAETAVSHAWRYDGYGRLVHSVASGVVNPWLYQGRLQLSPDTANPLYEFSARFYDPNLGVFTQLDSYAGAAQDPMSLNRYLYAAANPATLIDPTGHKAEMGAGSGTMTRDQYRHHRAREISDMTAAARTSVHEQRIAGNEVYAAKPDGGFIEVLHTGLDFAGFIPVVGIGADFLNGTLYAAQGDLAMAGLSFVAAVPIAGDAVGAAKLTAKYGDDAVGFAAHWSDEAADAVSSCARHSFRPDTPVWTAGGLVAISSIAVGDEVLAWDEETGELDSYEVTATWTHDDPLVLELALDDGSTIATTPGHPFYVVGAGWTVARELAAGSLLASADGDPARVEAISVSPGPAEMWDLTVAEAHTFFVGEAGVLVHNTCGFASGRGPHSATGSVTDSGGRTVWEGIRDSGRMTADEAALGFPQSSLATHSERRLLSDAPLRPGDTFTIRGSYPPCPTCKGAMNSSARSSGATIVYEWNGQMWRAR